MWLYVGIIAAIMLVCFWVMLAKVRIASASLRKLAEQVGTLAGRVDAVERRSDSSREAASAELEARTTAKIDKTAAELRDLIERHRAELDPAIRELDVWVREAGTVPDRPRGRAVEAAGRAPASGGKAEPGQVPTAFLTSEAAPPDFADALTGESLRQLKSELQLAIRRIERAESLLLKREGEERAVIGAPGDAAVPEDVSAEEAEFEEWEQEAKELAEGEEGEEAVATAAEPFREPPTEYPGEMGETGDEAPTELLEADLYEEDDVDLPEIEDEEEPQGQ
jgi:outer membrane murein-binding lipoprotein Lpp